MISTRGFIAILAGLCAAAAIRVSTLTAAPEGDREISLYHIHTKETLTVTYKRNGKYVPEAMDKLDWILRDWRKDKATKMSPETIDILWEVHTELGSREPIHIISGYRSPETNEMLRRTVGGQAKNSQHMTGKAIDVYFPDVPSRFVRYAALVRERGGVGYYPTSAMPFTHIDSGRVRHWPKIPKDELALLFPSGKSKHVPAGGPLRSGDFERAKSRNRDLYTQVAAYNELRNGERPVVIAADFPVPPAPKPAARPAKRPEPAKPPSMMIAALAPAPQPRPAATLAGASEPKLVAAPRPVERGSRFTQLPENDRAGLASLIQLAALTPAATPPPRLMAEPALVERPRKAVRPPVPTEDAVPSDTASTPEEGSYDPDAEAGSPPSLTGWGATFVPAPAYDDDHPEELSYRPFPLGPMLTASASPDDPALTELVHPDVARTLEVLDEDGAVLEMRLRPPKKLAALMWAQQFRGAAVSMSDVLADRDGPPTALAKRPVKTTSR